MSRVELHYGAATDVGRVREVNEDAYLAAPPLFVVADGMGGHDGGDVASRIVVEEFARLADEGYDPRRGAEAVAATLAASHDTITAYADEQARRTGRDFQAGTTAVVALLVEDDEGPRWLLANLGDSRAYRFVGGELEQVSVDHSLVQELVDEGSITREEMAAPPGAPRRDPRPRRTPARRRRLLRAPAAERRTPGAVLRRRDRDDRRRGGGPDPRARSGDPRTRPTGWSPRRCGRAGATTRRPSSSMSWARRPKS